MVEASCRLIRTQAQELPEGGSLYGDPGSTSPTRIDEVEQPIRDALPDGVELHVLETHGIRLTHHVQG